MKVFRGKLELACLYIHVSVCPRVSPSVQNTSACQSAGRGIKSHLKTALVFHSGFFFFIILDNIYLMVY